MVGAPSREAARSVEARSLLLMGISGVNDDASIKPGNRSLCSKFSISHGVRIAALTRPLAAMCFSVGNRVILGCITRDQNDR
jgi:hypothetical protein